MIIGKFVCVYLIAINLLTFMAMIIDKAKAKRQQNRIHEKTLLFLAFIGGFAGAWVAITFFRHKTKKFTFLAFMMTISISWIVGIVVFLTQQNYTER